MEAWKGVIALPVVMLIVAVGVVMSRAGGGWDLFPYVWFGFTATFMVAFIALIRWGLGEEDAHSDEAEKPSETSGH